VKVSGAITLTTDFGLSDSYVGVMKGVILSVNPRAHIVDISHQIRMGSIVHAAGLIHDAYRFFPEGTVHVVVVDPGVGGQRRPIIVKTGHHLFVGPDNGLFSPVITGHPHTEVIHVTNRRYFLPEVSHTFHGRDIFAPVAAHLSLGVDPLEMGSLVADHAPLSLPKTEQKGDILLGQVIRVDHFGNLITNINRKEIEEFLGTHRPVVRVKGLVIEGVAKIYSDVRSGDTLALIGSSECLEIAVNLGRVCDRLGLDPGQCIGLEVELRRVRKNFKS
jgi:S-adenosylmethionine hydrolase